MKRLMTLFLQKNTVQHIEQAAAALTAYMGSARSGELFHLTWHKLIWNSVYDTVISTWPQPKVSKHKYITFHCDSCFLELDWYFIMGCYIMVGAGMYVFIFFIVNLLLTLPITVIFA